MNQPLRIPFCVNVGSIPEQDLESLLDYLENELGGELFRPRGSLPPVAEGLAGRLKERILSRELFFEVLADQLKQAARPSQFLSGPYIRLTPLQNGVLRISSVDSVPAGDTVYALDQVFDALRPTHSSSKFR